jgi:hypothetical protein
MIHTGERESTERGILTKIGERVQLFGFNPRPSGQSFYHDFESGKWALHVSFIPHKNDMDLTADVAIRINAVEDIVNRYDTKRTPAEKRKSMTIGGELGNISAGRPLRWTVPDVRGALKICDQLLDAFEKIGLAFLRAHSDVAAVHHVLTSPGPRAALLAPVLGSRYMRVVASAHVLGATSDIERLINRFEAKLLEERDPYLDDFRALCHGLHPRPV